MNSTANVNKSTHADSGRTRRSGGTGSSGSRPKRPPRRGAPSHYADPTGLSANSVDTDSTTDAQIFGSNSDLLTAEQEERRVALLRRLNQITQKKEMLTRRTPSSHHSSPVRDIPPSEGRRGRENRTSRFSDAKRATHTSDIRTSPLSPLSDPMVVDTPQNANAQSGDALRRSSSEKFKHMNTDFKKNAGQPPKPLPRAPSTSVAARDGAVSKNAQMAYCLRMVKEMIRLKDGFAFSRPIDRLWSREQLPNYFEIIKHPMDMGTVKARLEAGLYLDPGAGDESHNVDSAIFNKEKFASDMRLVFNNARTYNAKGDQFYEAATRLLEKFETKFAQMPSKLSEGANKKKSKKRKKSGFALPDRRRDSSRSRKKQAVDKPKADGNVSASVSASASASASVSAAPSGSLASVDTQKAGEATSSASAEPRAPAARKSMPKPKKVVKEKEDKGRERIGRKLVEDMTVEELATRIKLVEVRLRNPKMNGTTLYNALARALYDTDLSYDEKLYLGTHVTDLPAEKLSRVVARASQDQNSSVEVNNNEEVELDFESLGTKTLRDMQAIVNQTLNAKKGFKNEMPNGDVARIPRPELQAEFDLLHTAFKKKKAEQPPPPAKKAPAEASGLYESDDSDSSDDSSSGSGSDSSDDDSDSDSSADEDDAEDMRKRRERNLAHQQAMQKAGTPLQSPAAR